MNNKAPKRLVPQTKTQAQIVKEKVAKLRMVLEELRTEVSSVKGDDRFDLLDVLYNERPGKRDILNRVLDAVIVYYENGGE